MMELNKNYCIKEIANLKDLVIIAYVIIDDIYHEVTPTSIRKRINKDSSILSDSEIITISIVGELLTIDSEKAWLGFCKKNMRDLFPKICERSRFNRTRRELHSIIDEIRKKLTKMAECNKSKYKIIDSIPLPVCKFGRAFFHKTFRGYGATFGRCPSKKETYFDYKLHLLTSIDGFVTDFELTSSNVDDREALWDVLRDYSSITVLGDKGYVIKDLAPEIKREKDIILIPLKRKKDKSQYSKEFRQIVFKLRRRIEITASQLTDQLNIERVRAKSKLGLIKRLRSKILAYNLCFFINMIIGKDINFSRIKSLVFA